VAVSLSLARTDLSLSFAEVSGGYAKGDEAAAGACARARHRLQGGAQAGCQDLEMRSGAGNKGLERHVSRGATSWCASA
jgi:hypothetical protein